MNKKQFSNMYIFHLMSIIIKYVKKKLFTQKKKRGTKSMLKSLPSKNFKTIKGWAGIAASCSAK